MNILTFIYILPSSSVGFHFTVFIDFDNGPTQSYDAL